MPSWPDMNVAADTNILVRLFVDDEPDQRAAAAAVLAAAERVIIGQVVFCELVWVLTRRYRRTRDETALAVEGLLALRNIVCDRSAVEAGLAALRAGTDFVDGVIAHEGTRLGRARFVSFDREAVSVLTGLGVDAIVPSF